jgi:hypothetical protein
MGYVRKRVEKTIEVAEEERRRKLLIQRIDLARSGILAYNAGRVADAVKAFHSYLRILEEVKNVREGALTPSCFDMKKDVAELLMISGIYWDLVKLYDQTRSLEKNREFLHYLEKYIVFSKGMPYQALCAESLRKYIQKGRLIHKDAFTNSYESLRISRCFVVTSLLDVTSPRTLPKFRKFRDQILKKNKVGRMWVTWYYRYGPHLAGKIDRFPYRVRKAMGLLLDFLGNFLA